MTHASDHAPCPERVARHVRDLALRFPVTLKGPSQGQERTSGADVVELEPGVPGVHVEVDAETAARRKHPVREIISGDARAVEVTDEAVLR